MRKRPSPFQLKHWSHRLGTRDRISTLLLSLSVPQPAEQSAPFLLDQSPDTGTFGDSFHKGAARGGGAIFEACLGRDWHPGALRAGRGALHMYFIHKRNLIRHSVNWDLTAVPHYLCIYCAHRLFFATFLKNSHTRHDNLSWPVRWRCFMCHMKSHESNRSRHFVSLNLATETVINFSTSSHHKLYFSCNFPAVALTRISLSVVLVIRGVTFCGKSKANQWKTLAWNNRLHEARPARGKSLFETEEYQLF